MLVLYDTMWESTARMAEAIARGRRGRASKRQLLHLRRDGLTQIAAEVLDAAAVAMGSPTLNRGPMPAAAAALSYFAGLRPSGKVAVAFGSYGWGRGGPEAIDEAIQSLGWEIFASRSRASIVRRPRCSINVARPAAIGRKGRVGKVKCCTSSPKPTGHPHSGCPVALGDDVQLLTDAAFSANSAPASVRGPRHRTIVSNRPWEDFTDDLDGYVTPRPARAPAVGTKGEPTLPDGPSCEA